MQLKSLVRYPIDIRRARQLLASRQAAIPITAAREIVLDLRTPHLLFDCGRHLVTISHWARQAGSPFAVRCNSLLLAGMARKIHGREFLSDPHVRWIPSGSPLPDEALVLCDYEPEIREHLASGSSGRLMPIQLMPMQLMIGRDIDRSIPVMPYPMHPETLRQTERIDLPRLRQKYVRRGIFFAGNQKPKYGDAKMQRNFGVLSRVDVVQTLKKHFAARVTCSIDSVRSERTIILADSRTASIEASEWLPTLAGAQFFICCPGSSQPVCHNLIEAMSVGTIPLVEYGDRITPSLRDGENAICFDGVSGLLDAMERIDRLSQEEVKRLRQNAAEFYDNELCGSRFLASLRDGQKDLSAGRICMPFHDRNFYPPSRRLAA